MPVPEINERELSKGDLRKLTALRKSVGHDLGTQTFAKWHEQKQEGGGETVDKNAETIANALLPLIEQKKLKIAKNGYLVKRGRGRVIVTAME